MKIGQHIQGRCPSKEQVLSARLWLYGPMTVTLTERWEKTNVLHCNYKSSRTSSHLQLRTVQQPCFPSRHPPVQHTSASLTINENCDGDVRHDMETFLSSVVPEGHRAPWRHTDEGDDDMPAHVKASMFGCSLTYAHEVVPHPDSRSLLLCCCACRIADVVAESALPILQ